MNKKRNNKRALVISALSLLLCVTMLVGSTFAWFTDNATTSVNTIEAGTLKIDLQNKEGQSVVGKSLPFDDKDNNTLWEPGVTYTLPEVRIVNLGSLALKFKLLVNGITGENAKLADVLEVYVGENEIGILSELMQDTDGIAYGSLSAGESTDGYIVSLHMQESAGNAYQGLKLDNISFTVYATQDTVEYDSTTKQYDAGAEYLMYKDVLTQDEVAALNEGSAKNYSDTYIQGEINGSVMAGAFSKLEGETSTFENTAVEVDVTSHINNLAVGVYATSDAGTTFNNCVIKNTEYTGGDEGVMVLDLLAYQHLTTTLNGGEYGRVGVMANAALVVNGATVDYLNTAARDRTYKSGGVTVKAESKVGLIEVAKTGLPVNASSDQRLKLIIEAGATVDEIRISDIDTSSFGTIINISKDATVGKIILNGTEYTVESWIAAGLNDNTI